MSTVNDLPRRLRDAVTKEFQGEPILWAGRPSAMRTFLVSTLIWLFAIPWTAFALGWEWMALGGWLSGKPPKDGIETVFLMAEARHQAIASKLVKEIARLGGDVSKFVTPAVHQALKDRLGRASV